MQQDVPITIKADGQFSSSLKPLLNNLEMWINFQALKADWYGNEDVTLCFDFTLIRRLEEKTPSLATGNWHVASGYAYHYESSNLTTIAFIALDDLLQSNVGIEQAIKQRLINVTNSIALQHGFQALTL
ncbi:hypothetical protein [Psychromonas hadalis]|uniref:hypothetical protein n=1 Tax=Psychromonas hadalis TaxID=211669 RepID=UPI0003B5BFDD|nr:hypothetical protein [Psychromonas hadalis]